MDDLEVTWPLSKWDYLTLPDPITMTTGADETPTSPMAATPGRDLAARALLETVPSQERAAALMGFSRRTVARAVGGDLAALRDPVSVEIARKCLDRIERNGATVEERDAALAWLDRARRDEPPVGSSPVDMNEPPPQAVAAPPVEPPSRRVAVRLRHGKRKTSRRMNGQPVAAVRRVEPAPRPGLAPEQLHLLVQQQQRILRRSVLIECVLKAEAVDAPTLREAVAEFLGDITEAAHTIGAVLQPRV